MTTISVQNIDKLSARAESKIRVSSSDAEVTPPAKRQPNPQYVGRFSDRGPDVGNPQKSQAVECEWRAVIKIDLSWDDKSSFKSFMLEGKNPSAATLSTIKNEVAEG